MGTAFAAVPFDHLWSCPARRGWAVYYGKNIFESAFFRLRLGNTPTKRDFYF